MAQNADGAGRLEWRWSTTDGERNPMSNAPLPPGASSPRDRGREERVPESRDRAPERERDREDDRRDPAPAVPTGGANSSTMALILHAVTALCCMNWIFGIAGITFAPMSSIERMVVAWSIRDSCASSKRCPMPSSRCTSAKRSATSSGVPAMMKCPSSSSS